MQNKKSHSRLWLYFTGVIFGTLFICMILILLLWLIMYRLHVIDYNPLVSQAPIVLMILVSIILGGSVAIFVGRRIIRPIHGFSEAFDRLSDGDFSVRVSTDERITEISEMGEHFNAMAYDLSHTETLHSDFLTNVSHEFKTPIAAIEGYATLLQNQNLSPERHAYYVDKILANSSRLTTLCSNVLTLSKLENEETVLHKKEFRIDEQIRRNVLLLENKWSVKNIEFDIDMPRKYFYGNEQLLDLVWINILDNAVKHSPNDSTIEVLLSVSENKMSVTVTDHGEGMSKEVQKHIFEKFYQGDSSHDTEGNGLGMSLVKRIVDLCHGSIDIVSAPGEGASFTVTLPDNEAE